MIKQYLAHFPHIGLIAFGLFLFLTIFIMIFIWSYHPKNLKLQESLSQLPLDTEENL